MRPLVSVYKRCSLLNIFGGTKKDSKVWLPLKACVQYGFSTQWQRCALNLDQIIICVIKWSEVSTEGHVRRAMLSSALRAVYSICCLQPRMLNIQIQGLVELAQESYGNTHTHTHTLCSMLATAQLATLLGICSRRSRPHFIVENLFYS